ncbi:hypothetical protein BGZ60DRAFT_512535 [Tricladium varicosporioides]|nr:hypothetical protein BGZ60DRAFT_512535 [Hymenoscyphus varicosporioides]
MDETGVMLCKDDPRDYRGANVKRTMVTAIECISADASTYRSNWTTFSTPGWHYAYSESGYTDSKISFEWLRRCVEQSGSCPEDVAIQSPVTPVSAEALTSLHSIIKQDTHTLTGTSTDRLQKHIQKLANAAQVSFAELALLRDQNQFLIDMNNEAKVRRSTRSVVLGTAKVMSFEDIEEARAKRTAKDALKGKGKRGRKRNIDAIEADEDEPEPEPEPQVACAAKEVKRKRGRKRRSTDTPEPEVALVMETPWRAPVACMI